MNLKQKTCVSCEGGDIAPLTSGEAETLLVQIPGWEISEDVKKISNRYAFKDFKSALVFVNKVGVIAEIENHHPDIHMTDYKYVNIDLSTHAIGGLSENDFIVAAKIDGIDDK
jgi:4a-hydroxytetrahydrobiopterin dehydratase